MSVSSNAGGDHSLDDGLPSQAAVENNLCWSRMEKLIERAERGCLICLLAVIERNGAALTCSEAGMEETTWPDVA